MSVEKREKEVELQINLQNVCSSARNLALQVQGVLSRLECRGIGHASQEDAIAEQTEAPQQAHRRSTQGLA